METATAIAIAILQLNYHLFGKVSLSLEYQKRDLYIINLTEKLLDRTNDGVALDEIAHSIQENLFYTYAFERGKYNGLEER